MNDCISKPILTSSHTYNNSQNYDDPQPQFSYSQRIQEPQEYDGYAEQGDDIENRTYLPVSGSNHQAYDNEPREDYSLQIYDEPQAYEDNSQPNYDDPQPQYEYSQNIQDPRGYSGYADSEQAYDTQNQLTYSLNDGNDYQAYDNELRECCPPEGYEEPQAYVDDSQNYDSDYSQRGDPREYSDYVDLEPEYPEVYESPQGYGEPESYHEPPVQDYGYDEPQGYAYDDEPQTRSPDEEGVEAGYGGSNPYESDSEYSD
ncbi:hypothetical protein C8R43DRAFT_206366 [Mycena crocata]|nr:hypothetical protein C8R43DRAFT_206366 [Mycena crocata]